MTRGDRVSTQSSDPVSAAIEDSNGRSSQDQNPQAAHDQVFRLIMAAWGSQAVRTLATLSVAEHLDSGPLTATAIAQRESSDPAMTYRVLRAGVALGLLAYDEASGTFAGTHLLPLLHQDSPTSLKHYAQAAIGPAFWPPALLLTDAVRDGSNQAPAAIGSDVFTYFSAHPEEARMFGTAMTDLSEPVIRTAVSVIEMGDAKTVVDVGGADGAFTFELVRQHPQATGIVFDRPHAMPGVLAEAERRGLQDRVTGVPGDFFESVPAGDIYLLKFIMHDWDDPSCVRILSTVRRAMNPGARVLIVEMAMTAQNPSANAALMDMAMLFATTGQERELSQFTGLLAAAKLRQTRVTSLQHPYHLIEAVSE
jgi:trans-aconitate methyltransferase